MKDALGRIAYGALFVLVWPGLLVFWAGRLDELALEPWPQPLPGWLGAVMALTGAMLMLASMWALWRSGGGLPMNAYPPTRLVVTSTYRWLSHPIYVGFVLAVAGISVVLDSSAGLWVVTPVSALAACALVVGYEGPKLRERFGEATTDPWFGVPPMSPEDAPFWRRLAAGVGVLGTWACIYAIFSLMPAPRGAAELRMDWEYLLARPDWAVWLYSATYPAVIVTPLLLRTYADLRRFVVGGRAAIVIGFSLMVFLPGRAALLPTDAGGYSAWLLDANRVLDADWLAFPSFHVLWMVFAAYGFTRRLPRLKPLWWTIAACIFASCILSGSHALVDVVGGAGLGFLCWNHDRVWDRVVRWCERVSNAWTAIQLGPIRIINHAVWSALAAGVGGLLVASLAGPQLAMEAGVVIVIGLISAGAWGYWLEGGERLSRPFGYYGFLIGALGAIAAYGIVDAAGAGYLAAAFAASAPIAQAVGRLRCLVQGCCHGRPVSSVPGLRVTHPMSRVTALANLGGVPIHPTQAYSIAGNLFSALVLLRLWDTAAPWSLIAGLYLILSSLARFAEEQYRGEPQTVRCRGLVVYQWYAVVGFVFGILLTMVPANAVKAALSLTAEGVMMATAIGFGAAFLMSVDFPRSGMRFSLLTVSDREARLGK